MSLIEARDDALPAVSPSSIRADFERARALSLAAAAAAAEADAAAFIPLELLFMLEKEEDGPDATVAYKPIRTRKDKKIK